MTNRTRGSTKQDNETAELGRRAGKLARAASDEIGLTNPSRKTADGGTRFSDEEIYRLIQESAYYRAQARSFEQGHEVEDWIEAEAEVRRRLKSL